MVNRANSPSMLLGFFCVPMKRSMLLPDVYETVFNNSVVSLSLFELLFALK